MPVPYPRLYVAALSTSHWGWAKRGLEEVMYIYLGDIGDWTITHPGALGRLPPGYEYIWAGDDGAWADPVPHLDVDTHLQERECQS